MAEVREPGDHRVEMGANEPAALGPRFPDVLSRAVAGDRAAFGELWRSAQPSLLRYLFVLCGGPAAEDVASETWLKVIRSLPTFSGDERAFRAWLATVARNAATDKGRQMARHPERLAGLLLNDEPDARPATDELALEALSTQAALEMVVTTLAPAVAEMVVLRVVIGLDVAQVAALVGRSPGAVRVAVHRGLKALAATLAPAATAPEAPDEFMAPVTTTPSEAFLHR